MARTSDREAPPEKLFLVFVNEDDGEDEAVEAELEGLCEAAGGEALLRLLLAAVLDLVLGHAGGEVGDLGAAGVLDVHGLEHRMIRRDHDEGAAVDRVDARGEDLDVRLRARDREADGRARGAAEPVRLPLAQGLRPAGHLVERVQQLGLVVVIYAGIMACAIVWLRFFRMGPFEWAWRSLTYWKWLPIRK